MQLCVLQLLAVQSWNFPEFCCPPSDLSTSRLPSSQIYHFRHCIYHLQIIIWLFDKIISYYRFIPINIPVSVCLVCYTYKITFLNVTEPLTLTSSSMFLLYPTILKVGWCNSLKPICQTYTASISLGWRQMARCCNGNIRSHPWE